MTGLDLEVDRIARAAHTVDPVFRDSPQFVDEQLCAALGRQVLVKVETQNPLHSFKGPGAEWFAERLELGRRVICASSGHRDPEPMAAVGGADAGAGRRPCAGARPRAHRHDAPVRRNARHPARTLRRRRLAAIATHDLLGERLATVLTGSNPHPQLLAAVLTGDRP